MRKIFLRVILAAIFALAGLTASAQQAVSVEESVKQIVSEFDDIKGFNCMVLSQGLQFKIVKEVFKQKFGKEFMKDVTSIVLIDYSKASEENRRAFRSKIEAFSGQLQEFGLNKQEAKDGQYTKGFATTHDDALTISNFMVITESDSSALFLYMGGTLNTGKMELNL